MSRSRWELRRRYDARRLPLVDLGNIRQPLNLVYTSRMFQPGVEELRPVLPVRRPEHRRPPDRPVVPGRSAAGPGAVRLAGHGVQSRSAVAAHLRHRARPAGRHRGRLHRTDRSRRARSAAGQRARPTFVPQLEVLARAALFVTHGGMNSVNEAMYAGVPMLVVPQGADQPLVAGRVVELGAGLSIRTEDVDGGVRARPSPGDCSTTPGSSRPRPRCRPPSARRVASIVPPTNSSTTCRRPARPIRRASIPRREADRCHPSSCCCCRRGCRRPPVASCPWSLAGPGCRGRSWPGCCWPAPSSRPPCSRCGR